VTTPKLPRLIAKAVAIRPQAIADWVHLAHAVQDARARKARFERLSSA
jgi:hypothetical protein